MNGIYQHYIIDLSSNNNFVQIPTVQGDGNNIRGFEIELIQNNMQYNIDSSDTLIYIMGRKPDTCHIMNDCTITEEGYILIDITSQMSAVMGRGDYQIVMMSKSTNSQLKSFPFHIITSPATFDVDYITSTDEFQALTKNITRTEVVIEEATDAIHDIRNLEDKVKKAEASRVNAEKSRVSAESIRESNESTRISNENTRKSNEVNRKTAETDRASAESTRISNENTRISNENTRKTNESNRKTAEVDRSNAEAIRNSAESTRITNENTRKNNEETRKTAESNRVSTESDRVNAENIRIANENKRKTAETTRQTNETNRQTNTATAISNSDKATDRANRAAERCENIASGILPVYEIVSTTEPTTQNVDEFWLQEYEDPTDRSPVFEIISPTEPSSDKQLIGDSWLQEY